MYVQVFVQDELDTAIGHGLEPVYLTGDTVYQLMTNIQQTPVKENDDTEEMHPFHCYDQIILQFYIFIDENHPHVTIEDREALYTLYHQLSENANRIKDIQISVEKDLGYYDFGLERLNLKVTEIDFCDNIYGISPDRNGRQLFCDLYLKYVGRGGDL